MPPTPPDASSLGAAAGVVAAAAPASEAPFAPSDRRAVLAASAPWLGALLNVLPGVGAGYLYQRRWRAWWITTILGALGFALTAQGQADAAEGAAALRQSLGLLLLLLLAAVTAAEAFLAARRSRMP